MQTVNPTSRSCLYSFKAIGKAFSLHELQRAAIIWCKQFSVVQNSYWIAMACFACMLGSCQKERLTQDATINSTMESAGAATAKKQTPVAGMPGQFIEYGAFICPPTTGAGWLGFQQNVAGQLGITCLRGCTLVPGNGLPPSLLTSGYNVVFNFNSNNDEEDGGAPTPFVSNLTQYKIDLNNILALCPVKPIVAVIENEECNRFYYSGTAWDYIKQLNAAIGVMHANGIKVTNGGLTGGGLEYLVYQDFITQGKEDSAKLFQQITHVTPNSPVTQERGVFVDSLLLAYNQMDVDYVNFHWKSAKPDEAEGLKKVINYLKKRCYKPIISNELGQHDKDPNTLLAMVQVSTDQNLPYVIWYSPDENRGRKSTPLQYNDASLTPSGVAYQSFLAK